MKVRLLSTFESGSSLLGTWPGRKHQKTDDDSPDLRDLMNFQKELDRMADLRVCAVCGEEHGKHLFPTTLTYDPKDIFYTDGLRQQKAAYLS